MNEKNSHCMNKVRLILLLCLLSCSAAVLAQTNVALVRLDSLSRSYAEVYGRYEEGEFRDTWQAPRMWSAGAATGSVRHFDRMSLTGSFSFDQTEGYGMCGSMFIKPGYFPIDVLEFTPGRKTLQTYTFDGGIAYDLDGTWTIGARMDFESSNLAKRKDLRHANWRLDMQVAPGVMYRTGGLALGFSPLFRKVAETINAEQIGTAESSYYAFLDKGLMYGVHQVWTGSGIHLDEAGVNGLPLKEYSYGGALQAKFGNLYADFEFLRTSGVAGEKEYLWFEFPGMSIDADMRYSWTRGDSRNNVSIRFDWKRQDLDENVLEKVNENGITTVLDHGSNRIFSRSSWSLSPEYENVYRDILKWKAGADYSVYDGVSSQMYPYVYVQTLTEASLYAGVFYHMTRFLDLGIKSVYSRGWISQTDRTVSEDSGVQSVPFRLQDWYDRQMEYRTASRIGASLMLRYNFMNGMYLETDFDFVKASGLEHITGPYRFAAAVKAGYNF